MTTTDRTTFGRFGFGLAGLAVGLAAGCGGPDPTGSNPTPPITSACGLYAANCVPLAGSSPNGLAIADLNGDQMPDIAVANMGADNLSVLLNTGGGQFAAPVNYRVGDSPFVIKIADFNGDGYPDLTSTGGSAVYTWLNNGDATFRKGATTTLSDPPFNLTVADFNGDGAPDIAAANDFYRSVTILLNDGKAKFTQAPQIFVPADFTQLGFITTADVNGDSPADLIVVHTYGGDVSVFKGNGDGSFATPAQVNLGTTERLNSATPVDVDGDGHIDIAVADYGNPLDKTDPGSVVILRNDGTGAFAMTARFPAGTHPISIAAADYNADGPADLAVANSSSNNVSILFGTGDGAFAAPQDVPVGEGPSFVATADLNDDGSPDLAVTNLQSDSVSILLNDGSGNFAPQP